MNTEKITNGGVKHVAVKELQDPDFVLVRIIDNEGAGEELERFILRKDHVRPVPTLVENHMLDNFLMGPSWFWSAHHLGGWDGQFATLSNHKVSDNFKWKDSE